LLCTSAGLIGRALTAPRLVASVALLLGRRLSDHDFPRLQRSADSRLGRQEKSGNDSARKQGNLDVHLDVLVFSRSGKRH
jgi:hypothetical protein